MTDSVTKFLTLTPPARIPLWIWLLALGFGLLLAGASLNYAPAGRINVLWLWLLWAGLPLLGSLISLWMLCFGRAQPWLFRWRRQQLHWHPSPAERLAMLGTLQQLWLLAGLGLLLGYLTLLLFTDLAFGWSSTLIDQPQRVVQLSQTLAAPWQWFWPTAVPSVELVEATRYARINPQAGDVQLAGGWWQFLLASLLLYNLFPRALLALMIALKLRWGGKRVVLVRSPSIITEDSSVAPAAEDLLAHWQTAPALNWEIGTATIGNTNVTNVVPAAHLQLGIADWHSDEQSLQDFLQGRPERIRWQVNASRSPVAELADLIARARAAGVDQQALQPIVNSTTDPQRHIASWRAFADKQQLVWLKDSL